jgi:hypothetical protein
VTWSPMWCGKHTHVIRKTIATSLDHCCKNIRTLQQIRLLDTNWVNLWLVVWNMAFMTFHVDCLHPNWPASMVFCHISCGCFVCFCGYIWFYMYINIVYMYILYHRLYTLSKINIHVCIHTGYSPILVILCYIYIYTPSEYVLSVVAISL